MMILVLWILAGAISGVVIVLKESYRIESCVWNIFGIPIFIIICCVLGFLTPFLYTGWE